LICLPHYTSEYLRQVWFDTVTPIGLAIKYAWDFAGPDKLLYSSDHPWMDPQLIIRQVDSQGLPRADLSKLPAQHNLENLR
jgi:predicted TIM-barrel fold metal-dependent hydrolase